MSQKICTRESPLGFQEFIHTLNNLIIHPCIIYSGRYTISESSTRPANAPDMMLMTSHLVVPVVDVADAGEYTCNAISDHDQTSATIAQVQGKARQRPFRQRLNVPLLGWST